MKQMPFFQRGLYLLVMAALFVGAALSVWPTAVAYAANYTVTTVDDNDDGACDVGHCSLREAINAANANPGADTITFKILEPAGPTYTIQPGSSLPPINDTVVIDGTTQPGYIDSPIVILDGSSPEAGETGIFINSSGNIIRGLVINQFGRYGLEIQSGSGNLIEENFIGTNADGNVALGNGDGEGPTGGIRVCHNASNTTIQNNLISGNNGRGIFVGGGQSSTIRGNLIGTDSTGANPLGNTRNGVELNDGATNNIIGGTTIAERNTISGNSTGIVLFSSNTTANIVKGNYIGLDISGTQAIPNEWGVGIDDGAHDNTIGGTTAAERNVISGNNHSGVAIHRPGATGNVVTGNYIGTDAVGANALPNGYSGVNLNASDNVIGGPTPGERNIISGNAKLGINMFGGISGNLIQGNYIGTDVTGTVAVPNGSHDGGDGGIFLGENNGIPQYNTFQDNVISGNIGDGMWIVEGHYNTIVGNLIGTDASGTLTLPNSEAGLSLFSNAAFNVIGGETPAERNIISGNASNAIMMVGFGTTGNLIQGNYIGTDIHGTAAVPNSAGVTIGAGATGNIVDHNVISGNLSDALYLSDVMVVGVTDNVVTRNFIGTDETGTLAIPNQGKGVHISGGSNNNTIGGENPGEGNLIAHNLGEGVVVTGSETTFNAILGNAIFDNAAGWLDIDLGVDGPDGVTANDAGDADTGANNLQNYPVITAAISDLTTTIAGVINSQANTTFRVEFFSSATCAESGHGGGETYLGHKNVATDGSGDAEFTFSPGDPVASGSYITATATDPGGNTSEFSACEEVASYADGDGIAYDVDTLPTVYSADFSDVSIGGTTTGTITDRGDQLLEVTEEANPDGVRIAADPAGGSIPAKVRVCGDSATLSFKAGDAAVVTCGSVMITTVSGTIDIVFIAEDGMEATTSLDEGNSLTFDPTTSTFIIPATNIGVIIVVIEGEEIGLEPGGALRVVDIDIKPGSENNCINNDGQGVIPVAVLSSLDFDATQVDPLSISLNGQEVRVVGKKGNIQASAEDVNEDGLDDLVVQIEDEDGTYTEGDAMATLTGATFDGTSIVGFDRICIVP